MNAGRRVGFVDYRLENFHSEIFLHHLREEWQARGWVVSGCYALDETGGRAWAQQYRVPYFNRLDQLDAVVDAYIILAPSNPELHLELCRRVFPFRKPTFVDKPFAPDLATAREIFALADRLGVPIQSSSALRYTNVQGYVREVGRDAVRHMVAWGGGRSFAEYGIHPVELVVSCMGARATGVMRRGDDRFWQVLIDFIGGRTAVVNVSLDTQTPFAAAVTTTSETRLITVDGQRLFLDTLAGMLDFFEAGTPLIDRGETLMIRQILDAAQLPQVTEKFIPLEEIR